MPYLRLYSRNLPIDQRRVIAQRLIEITLRTFHLRADQRYRTTIQFITLPGVGGADELQSVIPRNADFALEVIGHNLPEEGKKAFTDEAEDMLARLAPLKLGIRIAQILRIRPGSPRRVDLRFSELAPAISDPFFVDSQHRAA
jgi:hypothetical protein